MRSGRLENCRPVPPASCSAVLLFTPPMLATTGRPDGTLDDWVVEPKADGWRAQVAVDGDGCRVWTRTGRDITGKVPEVSAIAELGVECVLDGELVAGAGLPSDFYPLAGMLSARRRSQRLTFVAFDVLGLHGRSLVDYDLASRRQVLECLVRLSEGALTAVHVFPGSELDDVLAGCEQLSMEGVVVKRRASLYVPAGPPLGRVAQGEMPGVAGRPRRTTTEALDVILDGNLRS